MAHLEISHHHVKLSVTTNQQIPTSMNSDIVINMLHSLSSYFEIRK
jgi:hypothetical protein